MPYNSYSQNTPRLPDHNDANKAVVAINRNFIRMRVLDHVVRVELAANIGADPTIPGIEAYNIVTQAHQKGVITDGEKLHYEGRIEAAGG